MPETIRIGYIHSYSLCWTYFHYHLIVQSKSLDIRLLERPISSLFEQITQIKTLLDVGVDVLVFKPVGSVRRSKYPGFRFAASRLRTRSGPPFVAAEAVIRRAPQGTMSEANCAGLGGFVAPVHTVQFATLIDTLQVVQVFRSTPYAVSQQAVAQDVAAKIVCDKLQAFVALTAHADASVP